MYVNRDPEIEAALEKLGQDFPRLNWDFSLTRPPAAANLFPTGSARSMRK